MKVYSFGMAYSTLKRCCSSRMNQKAVQWGLVWTHVNFNSSHRLREKWHEAKKRKVNTPGFHFLPLLKHFCSPYSEFHSKNNTTETVTQSVLIHGTFRLMRRLLNIKHSFEVLTKTATDVQKLPHDTGIYKSERLCWGLATAKQTLASGIHGTWALRSQFLTSIGQVSKLVLMVSRQRTAWT